MTGVRLLLSALSDIRVQVGSQSDSARIGFEYNSPADFEQRSRVRNDVLDLLVSYCEGVILKAQVTSRRGQSVHVIYT